MLKMPTESPEAASRPLAAMSPAAPRKQSCAVIGCGRAVRPQPGPPLQRTVISSVCDHGVWCVITQKPYCEWGLETPGHL